MSPAFHAHLSSQHILDRLEPVYHRALHWASGLPRFVPNRKLFLLARSPPLRCILDYLSTRYAIRLMFAATDHPLQQHTRLESRMVQQLWLNMMRVRQSTITYPILRKPLSLAARSLRGRRSSRGPNHHRTRSESSLPDNSTAYGGCYGGPYKASGIHWPAF